MTFSLPLVWVIWRASPPSHLSETSLIMTLKWHQDQHPFLRTDILPVHVDVVCAMDLVSKYIIVVKRKELKKWIAYAVTFAKLFVISVFSCGYNEQTIHTHKWDILRARMSQQGTWVDILRCSFRNCLLLTLNIKLEKYRMLILALNKWVYVCVSSSRIKLFSQHLLPHPYKRSPMTHFLLTHTQRHRQFNRSVGTTLIIANHRSLDYNL